MSSNRRLKLDCACLQLRQAARLVSQHYDTVLRPIGLRSTQFAVMAAIQANDPIALPDLAKGLVVDRSTLTRNLAPLERSGFVKLADRRGERVRFVKLTAKGRRALEAATPLWQEAQEILSSTTCSSCGGNGDSGENRSSSSWQSKQRA